MTVPAKLVLLAISAILTAVPPSVARAESIHDLAFSGNVDRALALLSEDPTLIAARDANGRTPLHMATRGGHLAVVEALIVAGADVNAVDRDGTPPLHSAAYRGHEAILRFLLAYGADPDARDARGNTALIYALYASRRANVARLLEAGADVNLMDSFGSPPLHSAVRKGFREETVAILARGALIDATGYNGSTAVHLAIENGHRNLLDLLLALGADTTIADAAGNAPLHTAAMHGDPAMLPALLAKPHDLEAKNKLGRTPLHLALALLHGHRRVAAALDGSSVATPDPPLRAGASPDTVTAWYLGNSGWAVRVGSKLLGDHFDCPPDERSVVESTIRDAIGWALTKDRARLESIMAHDADFFIFHPDSKTTVRGYEAFAKMIPDFMDPRFVATRFDVRDVTPVFSRSGDVAWYSAMLEDCGTWMGKESCWKETRWTGVLEKRDGRWLIVQMHFSFAKDKVLEECAGVEATQ